MIAFLQEETPDGEADKAQAEDDDYNPPPAAEPTC